MDIDSLAQALFGSPRAETQEVATDGTTRTYMGVAMSDSDGGTVVVDLGGDVTLPDDLYDEDGNVVAEWDGVGVEMSTSPQVLEGEDVIVTLVGGSATKKPMVTAVAGTGDRQGERINAIEADYVKATELEADVADIGFLKADSATITALQADTAKVHDLTAAQLTAATGYVGELQAGSVSAQDIVSGKATVGELVADHVSVSDLDAATARIGDLEADHVSVSDFQAEQANIDNLQAATADIDTIRANSAKVQNLTAAQLEADHATIGTLDTTYMHANMSNSDVAWIENGTIKNGAIVSAMINDVSANKLTAGTINGSVINVTNLNADNITTGTINGQRIGEGSLSLDKLSESVYTEAEVDNIVDGLNDRIDGAIETHTGTTVPTLNNAPASSWNTTKLRDEHVGDVYYVVNSQSQQNGYCYRFTKSGSTYSWQLIKDSDVTAALSRLTTAEGKITTFDSDISTLKTTTGTLTTKTESLETRMSDAEADILDKVDTTTFNEVSDTVDAHTQTISQHTTAISNKADSSTVTAVTNRVSKNEQDISGINTTIGELQDTVESKADGSTVSTISNRLNTVSDTVDGHTQTLTSVQNTLSSKADSSTVSTLTTKVNTIEDTVDGHTSQLSSITSTQTTMQSTLDKTVKSSIQLWYSKANTTAPSKPTSKVTSTSTSGNAWRIVVPAYNSSYPHYYYCWQYEYVDGTYGWSAVVRDIAMGESQSTARTADSNAASAVTTATNAQTTANANIKSSVQLWFTKANSTAPNKPTSVVSTSNANTANAWNLVVPVWNKNYPHYFYCYQQQKGDGNYQWTDVVYDRATSEAQQLANTTSTNLSTLQTDYATFKQTTEQFESTVGTTYATKTELNDATDDITALEGRVSTNETSISNNASAIALKANSSDVYTKSGVDSLISTEVTNRNAAITAKANEITSSVSETYATKSSVNGKADASDVTALAGRVTTAESNITQNANNIALKVSETDVTGNYIVGKINLDSTTASIAAQHINLTGAVTISDLASDAQNATLNSNISVGGRNLFSDSKALSTAKWTFDHGATRGDNLATLAADTSSRIYQMPAKGYWSWKPNTEYVVSVEAKASASGGKMMFNMVGAGGSKKKVFDLTTSWARYSWAFTSDATVSTGSASIYNDTNTGTVQVRLPKLEEGNKATDWTAAPEDVDSAIEAVPKYKVRTTTYSYPLSSWLTYAAEGYQSNWSQVRDVKVGDTVLLKGTNRDTGDAVYLLMIVDELTSSGNVSKATSHGLVDPTAGQRADNAAKTATSYVTEITGQNGIMVHPSTDQTTGVRVTSDVDILRSGTSVANYGTTARIGTSAGKHVSIDSDSVDLMDGNASLATFGANDTHLGLGGDGALYLARDKFRVHSRNWTFYGADRQSTELETKLAMASDAEQYSTSYIHLDHSLEDGIYDPAEADSWAEARVGTSCTVGDTSSSVIVAAHASGSSITLNADTLNLNCSVSHVTEEITVSDLGNINEHTVTSNGACATASLVYFTLWQSLASYQSRVIGTLPVGYRPPTTVMVSPYCDSANHAGRCFVAFQADGDIRLYNVSGSTVDTGTRFTATATYVL